jgi:hypothetical protein
MLKVFFWLTLIRNRKVPQQAIHVNAALTGKSLRKPGNGAFIEKSVQDNSSFLACYLVLHSFRWYRTNGVKLDFQQILSSRLSHR